MSRKFRPVLALALLTAITFYSCESESVSPDDDIPEEVLSKLTQLGFSTEGVIHFDDGFLVETDIYLTAADISKMSPAKNIPVVEQYSTNNLVTATPRVISMYMPTGNKGFSSGEQAAFDEMISRYNARNLSLTFQRVSTSGSADIVFERLNKGQERRGILGSAGFPSDSGDPYHTIKMSGILESHYGLSTGGIATIMAHEVGHCIGMRHTDYFDRSISCGGSPSNEGDGGVGANHIPGTPTGATASAKSWMLACTDGGDRPFNNDDKTALDYLY